MPISAGTRLGPYEVLAPIGAGGMGEVFKARDTRLERSVAIKVLPADFAENAQLKMRFEREAKTISQLNHPHICTLYDVGDGYLVMELLEGETLAEKLSRGPLPIEQVVRYGTQIAEALEKAHKAGVVHRDLKPGNVMITKSGAKLLDFGLAKPSEGGVLSALTSLRTEKRNLTEEGAIVGTFQYMAPEQIEGGEVDSRTDIFALGAVLYEMATGKRAFEGKSKASLIASILTAEPQPISAMQPMTPLTFDRVVRTCLQKDPDERWQSAHDVAIELRAIGEAETKAPRKRAILPWSIAAALAALALITSGLYLRARTPASASIVRTTILPPAGVAFEFFVDRGSPEFSPDGKKIAFVGAVDGVSNLFVRSLDSPAARQLGGTSGASQVFWSPDSRYIGFYADGYLKKIEASGGAAVTICATETPIRGGTWSREGVILFGRPGTRGIARVPAAGGTLVDATLLDESTRDTSHRWPRFLPDGTHFLYLSGPHASDDSLDAICLGSLDDPKFKKILIHTTSNVAYYDGWLIFARDRTLTAQRFDVHSLSVVGEPVTLSEPSIQYDPTTGRSFFDVASDGDLLYETGEGLRQTQLTWFDRTGKRLGPVGEPQRFGSLALSPDGRAVAYSIIPRQNLWIYDLKRDVSSRLTFAKASEYAPVWSPDGSRIAFTTNRASKVSDIFVTDLKTGADRPLITSSNDKAPSSWSPDGRYLFYSELFPGRANDIMVYDFSTGKSQPYLTTPFSETNARVSPDGKWVAYQSTVSPPWHIFIAPFPPTGAKWQVSTGPGVQPRWRGDGKELYYIGEGKLHAVSLTLGFPPEIGQPVTLAIVSFSVSQTWDPASDGQKFLVNGWAGDPVPPAPLTLVQHFDNELRAAAAQ